jgi:hypothetical protein
MELLPGLGEPDLAMPALEERHAELLLQRLHLPADRRLGEEQLARSAREVQVPRSGLEAAPRLVVLTKREVLALPGEKGTRIESRRGHLWVTQDGDRHDVVLAEGEGHVLDRAGPVLVQALDAAVVVVSRRRDRRAGAPACGST